MLYGEEYYNEHTCVQVFTDLSFIEYVFLDIEAWSRRYEHCNVSCYVLPSCFLGILLNIYFSLKMMTVPVSTRLREC